MPDAAARRSRLPDPAMLAEIHEGLSRPRKSLPPKFFYDRRGSELFERITRLPEYYLTRTERRLLQEWMPALIARLGVRTLIELGAGSATKTRIILDVMGPAAGSATYVPIDVSAGFLEQTAERLRKDYPGLTVIPVLADFTDQLVIPNHCPHPKLVAILGSTIGNFEPAAAVSLLARVRQGMTPEDRLLVGVDLRKDAERLEAAYNDEEGITAEFNRNVLRVVNRMTGSDFDPSAFEHRAFYDRRRHRIEMRLVSARNQSVSVPGLGVIELLRGESIRTELSHKYDRATVEAMLASAGFRLTAWKADPERLFALTLGAPSPA